MPNSRLHNPPSPHLKAARVRKTWLLPVLVLIASAVFAEDGKQDVKPGEKVNRIALRSVGCAKVKADFSTLYFTLLGENEDAKDAQKILAKRVEVVKNHLKLPSVAAVDTFSTTMVIQPQTFRYSQKDGYSYFSKVAIRFWKIHDLPDNVIHEHIVAILDELNDIGITGEAITFTFDVDDPEALATKAYQLAVENAKTRAAPLAEAAGRKLGRISLISDETRSMKSTELYGITDSSSSDSTVDRKVAIYVEFELE